MARRLEATAARIRDSEDEVFGDLRVTTTTGFGSLWLAPRLPRLFERYPNLRLELMLEERILDLPMREADVAICMKEPSQADLIRRRIMDVHIRFYASRAYAARMGLPQTPEELAAHRLVVQSPNSHQVRAGADLIQQFVGNAESLLMVNNYFGILQAVLNGIRIGSLPDYVSVSAPISCPSCPISSAPRSRSTSPMSRNCGTTSASPPSATSCSRKSAPTSATSPPSPGRRFRRSEPCNGVMTAMHSK